jgi:hypothetical protein
MTGGARRGADRSLRDGGGLTAKKIAVRPGNGAVAAVRRFRAASARERRPGGIRPRLWGAIFRKSGGLCAIEKLHTDFRKFQN